MDEELELYDGSCFVTHIQDWFLFTIKKHKTLTDNPLVRINGNKIKKIGLRSK